MKYIVLKTALAVLLSITSLTAANDHGKSNESATSKSTHVSHWEYKGDMGPSHWGNLKSEYSTCGNGKRQSPIDITSSSATKTNAVNDIFVSYGNVDLNIINNGHTIQVNSDGTSKALLGGKEYKLLQFHFHSSSEHTLDGKYFPLEAHLVHQSADGELGVIGVMFEIGKHNSFMQKIFKFMPNHADGKTSNSHTINANEILPNDRSFYHYMGSLTTPPCTQIVQWFVLKNSITISQKQLDKFNSLYKGNFRPIQSLANRKILSK